MSRIAVLLASCLLALASALPAGAAAEESALARAVALARADECFRDQVNQARRDRQIVGRPVASPNADGTFTVSVSVCPPCTNDPTPCLVPCTAISAIVDPATGTVTCA